MEVKVVRVGNSSGVVIPSSFLRELGLSNGSVIDLSIRKLKGELLLKKHSPRNGWGEAFKKYAEDQDDLVFADFSEDEIVE